MKKIHLTQGKVALVDDEDFELVGHVKWCAVAKESSKYYAQRTVKKNGRSKSLLMHRVILGATNFTIIDHINGDGLDNQRVNLRIVTPAQNMFNRKPNTGKQFKGIRICKKGYRKIYRATIKFQRQEIHLGNYFTVEDAARAYDKKAIELFGGFARLNFPNERRLDEQEGY